MLRFWSICRNLSTKTNNNFTPIYKFPYIRTLTIINRLKIYQSAATLTLSPISAILSNLGFISTDVMLSVISVGVSGTLTLFLFGFLPNKLVGFLYVSENNETLKISYADFWGRRKDVEMPVKDVVPFKDLPTLPLDSLYITMRRFSSPDKYKINLRYGHILDQNKFKTVLYS